MLARTPAVIAFLSIALATVAASGVAGGEPVRVVQNDCLTNSDAPGTFYAAKGIQAPFACSGQVTSGDKADFYRFPATYPVPIVVTLEPVGVVDVDLCIFFPSGTELMCSRNAGSAPEVVNVPPIQTFGVNPFPLWALVSKPYAIEVSYKSGSGSYALTVESAPGLAPPPASCTPASGVPNDCFATATTLPSTPPFTFSQSTVGATAEWGEPTRDVCGWDAATVWYRFTPSTSGWLTFSTSANYGVHLGAFRGSGLGDLTLVQCQQVYCSCGGSMLSWPAVAGVTYYVMMTGDTGGGNLAFTVQQTNPGGCTTAPVNDCKNEATVIGVPSTTTISNAGATTQGGEPTTCGKIGSTLWYQLRPFRTSLPIKIDTFGSDFDTVIAVYRGNYLHGFNDMTLVACNDDASGGFQSSVTIANAKPYDDFMIQVGGHQGATGNLVLHVGT